MRAADLFAVLVNCAVLHLARGGDWAYSGPHGPDKWPGICTKGKKQSPINIETDDTVKTDLRPLKFVRYDYAFSGSVTNTGHTAQIVLTGVPIHLEGGSLPSVYVLEQMHFHWGSEHTVDGRRDALEMHFVHFAKEYQNVTEAAEHPNGLAVVAVLFQLSEADNEDLDPILKATKMVSGVGRSMAMIPNKIIPLLFLPKDHTTYYRYEGSLTTPNCQESVIWSVLTEKLTVSESQMQVFRNLGANNEVLKSNYREIQDLGSRTVYLHLDGYSGASSTTSALLMVTLNYLLVKMLRVDAF